ncbi:hypothetical protein KY284_027303 [Solanum tuberosum]|nr:hypothetical protein KY284_027303 [Solanum tuberosum]
MIGNPLKVDRATTQKERLTYARVLIEVPLNKEYPTEIMFENEVGRIINQRVEYEWKPVLCGKCKNFGHDISNCRRHIRDEQQGKIVGTEGNKENERNNEKEIQNVQEKVKGIGRKRGNGREGIMWEQHKRVCIETTNSFSALEKEEQGGQTIF